MMSYIPIFDNNKQMNVRTYLYLCVHELSTRSIGTNNAQQLTQNTTLMFYEQKYFTKIRNPLVFCLMY